MWVHNGFLTVNGEKMSKSLGNFITTRELLDKGINGEVIRFALLNSHYSDPLDWTDKLLYDSQKTLDRFYRLPEIEKADGSKPSKDLIEHLEDNLNLSLPIAAMRLLINEYNSGGIDEESLIGLRNDIKFLGFLNQTADEYFGRNQSDSKVEELINLRKEAKSAKNYAEADNIRQKLADMGIVIEDKPNGVTEWRKA
jgi:cysteinyl-tRNA synthetase